MLNILVLSRINYSSGRTNVYNITKSTDAINNIDNVSAHLLTTDYEKNATGFLKKYNVENLKLISLCSGSKKLENKNRIAGYLAIFAANFSVSNYIFKNRKQYSVIYLRDETLFLAVLLSKFLLRKKVFYEVHSVLQRPHGQLMNVLIAKSADGIIAISTGLKEYYKKYNKNIFVSLCSSYERGWFDYDASKKELREKLELPIHKKIIGYTGVVGANPNNDYYELDDIIIALKQLPDYVYFVVVGEFENNADWLRKIAEENNVASRLLIIGWQDRSTIPLYLQSFDITVIPKRKKDYTGDSPAKMFPSLASKTPIVAGNSDSIKEVLVNDHNALLVSENNAEGWYKALNSMLQDEQLVQCLSKQAYEDRLKYTWEKRGESIVNFINKNQ